jgi:hypothetical protein
MYSGDIKQKIAYSNFMLTVIGSLQDTVTDKMPSLKLLGCN